MAIGVNARTAFSLLFPPILEEFGWTRGTVAGVFSVGFLASMLFAPITGILLDKFGPRWMMPVGAIMTSAGAGACDRVHRTLALLYRTRCTRRRGKRLYRLYRARNFPPQLVRPQARIGGRNRLFRRRHRRDHPIPNIAGTHRKRRLA